MRLPSLRACRAVVLLALLAPLCARADTVVLANGDRYTGSVERIRAGKIELTTADAGTVFIDASKVDSVTTDRTVTIILKDYSRHIGRLVPSVIGSLGIVPEGGGETVSVPVSRVSVLLPGHLDESQWRITGRVNAGLTDTEGNTEVRRLNADAEIIARRNRDRLSFTARGNQGVERGENTEANATVGLKYDRFISERWYGYGGTTFEHDRFKDLRLRTTAGGGLGHTVIDSGRTALAFEAGLDLVTVDYFASPDQSNSALQIGTRFNHALIDGIVELFHNNQVFVGLAHFKQSFARSQSGLRFPMRAGLLFSVHLNLDWDGEPAPGRRSLDRSLVLSLGYRW